MQASYENFDNRTDVTPLEVEDCRRRRTIDNFGDLAGDRLDLFTD